MMIRMSPTASMRVKSPATAALSFIPAIRMRVRSAIRPMAAMTRPVPNRPAKYPPNPRATVAAPMIPEKMISQPTMNAMYPPTAAVVYSYSAPAFGNMEESSA